MNDRLRRLQLAFKAYLQQDDEAILRHVVDSEQARAEHRLAAYWNAYRLRLIESLGEDFPLLQRHLGEPAFEALILDYIAAHPSRHRSIRWVGQDLPAFLRRRGSELEAELADFEWSLGLCFDAPEADGRAGLDDMAPIPPEDWPSLRFVFDPSLRWIDPWWNSVAIAQALQDEQPPPPAERGSYPVRWLLWRQDEQLHWRSLEPAEAWAVEAAHGGAAFAELCEGLLEWHGEDSAALAAAGYLKQWLHDGLITRITR